MRSMDGAVRPLLLACLVLFVGGIVVDVGLVVVRIVLGFSGFDITTIAPSCPLANYERAKFTYIYLPLRTATVAAALAALLGVVGTILAARARSKLTQEGAEVQSQSVGQIIPSRGLFVVASFHCLFVLTNAAHTLSVLIDNKTCPIVDSTKWTILLAVALLALLIAVLLPLIVMVLHFKLPHLQDKNKDGSEGKRSEHRGQGGAKREEEELSRALEMQAKEYMSGSYKQKGDMLQGLMMNGDQIYQGNNRQEDQYDDYESQEDDQQERTNQKVGAHQQTGEQGGYYQEEGQRSNGPMNSPKGGSKRRGGQAAAKMHAYHLINNPTQEQDPGYAITAGEGGSKYNAERGPNYQGEGPNYSDKVKQFHGEEQSQVNQEDPRKQKLLEIEDDGDLSEKFDQKLFELEEQLNRAIKKDKEEDLSPLELKELMQFTQKQYKLTQNDEHSLTLEREYKVSDKGKEQDYRINIHFKKIKDHKINQTRMPDEEIQNPGDNEENKAVEPIEKPIEIGEDLIKILKVTLFKHSEFLQRDAPPVQEECPISRYVEKDERLEILQPDDKFKGGKNKKVQYSKEQLIYSKKKKDSSQEDKQKGSVRQEFNEGEYIKEERIQIFGEQWVRERRVEEMKQESSQSRHKKRKLVETIRSKYNH